MLSGLHFDQCLSKWGFVCDCTCCRSDLDDDLLTATAKLEADIRRMVTSPRPAADKDWARTAGWQDQVSLGTAVLPKTNFSFYSAFRL